METTNHQSRRCLVCNCQRTMTLDGAALSRALGVGEPLVVHTELCRAQLDSFKTAASSGAPLLVACTQEQTLFEEVAGELQGSADIRFTNIRETAGWTTARQGAGPKIAALLAAAAHVPEPVGLLTLASRGVCLVHGPADVAIAAAAALAGRLSVSVLVSDDADALPPARIGAPIARGRIARVRGHLGRFEVEVSGYAAALPSSRRRLEYAMARDGARSTCDVIVDLSGRPALFAESARRDGYLRADPSDPAAINRVLLKASDLVGEFEKPRYVAYDKDICAHARSAKVGCRKCLDACPTGAITPAGDHVAIDPALCGGCGMCSATCPTGAASYDYPGRADLLSRIDIVLDVYGRAGGREPVLLLHDEAHGGELIDSIARLGDGLAPNVIPLSTHAVTSLGHDILAGALALGAMHVVLLTSDRHAEEHAATLAEIELIEAILRGLGHLARRVHFVATGDPDVLVATLGGLPAATVTPRERYAFTGLKREMARTALARLHATAPKPVDHVALPSGAPYGRIAIRQEGCTLCLACVGACPANALADNPDRPELSFTAAACVQCGVCVATCPEKVISLAPGYDFTSAAMTPTVMKAEEPFHCVSCGKPFGTRSTIERVVERLKGRHAMFRNEAQVRLIEMCDTCRVVAVSESGNDPMRVGERPRMRTTDDYLADAAKTPGKKTSSTPDDFLS